MKMRIIFLLCAIAGIIALYSCQNSPTEAGSTINTTTLTGIISDGTVALSGIKVVDLNAPASVVSTVYTDRSGKFTLSYELVSQYTASLVVTDSLSTYNDTTLAVSLNQGDQKNIAIILRKNTSPIVTAVRAARQVSVIGISTNHIYSKGVGLLEGNNQLENCKMVLQVKDSLGTPIAKLPSYKATFSLNFYPESGAYGTTPSVNPDTELTDDNGQLGVTISSGTCAGDVQLVAQLDLGNGNTLTTEITRIVVYSGFADQSHFFIAPVASEGKNGYIIPYWGSYQTHQYSASVADTFGYAVPSGHAVSFIGIPGGPGKIGNNGISPTDVDGNAGLAFIAYAPSPSMAGYYTTTDPLTSGRRGYMWLQAQTMGKNGSHIQDSILILWNEGYIHTNQPKAFLLPHNTFSGFIDTLMVWDSNGNPLNATISVSVDLGPSPVQGEGFSVIGDIGTKNPVSIPGGDYRFLGEGNTFFVFGISDVSSFMSAGLSVTINISITCPNYPGGTYQLPGIPVQTF